MPGAEPAGSASGIPIQRGRGPSRHPWVECRGRSATAPAGAGAPHPFARHHAVRDRTPAWGVRSNARLRAGGPFPDPFVQWIGRPPPKGQMLWGSTPAWVTNSAAVWCFIPRRGATLGVWRRTGFPVPMAPPRPFPHESGPDTSPSTRDSDAPRGQGAPVRAPSLSRPARPGEALIFSRQRTGVRKSIWEEHAAPPDWPIPRRPDRRRFPTGTPQPLRL